MVSRRRPLFAKIASAVCGHEQSPTKASGRPRRSPGELAADFAREYDTPAIAATLAIPQKVVPSCLICFILMLYLELRGAELRLQEKRRPISIRPNPADNSDGCIV